MTIRELPANSVAAAVDFAEQCVRDGTWSQDTAHAVLHMQDDPDALIAALAVAGVRPPSRGAGRRPRVAAR